MKLGKTIKRKPSPIQLLLGSLLILNVITAFFLIRERTASEKIRNPYPLIDFARSYIPQENFIVNIQPLREALIELVEQEGSKSISVYLEVLNTGANISINKELRVWPASLIKLPVAFAALKKVEKGLWEYSTELPILPEHKDANFGMLWTKPPGSTASVETLLTEMLINSDNTAYHVFVENLTFAEVEEVIEALGLEELFTEEGKMSAKEYSRFFRALYTSSFLKRENSQKILTLLSKTDFSDFIASGVPAEVIFSHKFGSNLDSRAYLDSGIVYVKNRPYILTVAIAGDGSPGEYDRVKRIMRTIGEKTYQYVIQQ